MTFFFFPPLFLCRVTQRRSPLKRTPPIFTGGDNWGEPNVSIFWVEREVFPPSLPSFLSPPPRSSSSFLFLTPLSLSQSLLFFSESVELRRGAKNRRQCFFFPPSCERVCAWVCACVCEKGKKLGALPRRPQSCKDYYFFSISTV